MEFGSAIRDNEQRVLVFFRYEHFSTTSSHIYINEILLPYPSAANCGCLCYAVRKPGQLYTPANTHYPMRVSQGSKRNGIYLFTDQKM